MDSPLTHRKSTVNPFEGPDYPDTGSSIQVEIGNSRSLAEIDVRPLRHVDTSFAANNVYNANLKDPIQLYLHDATERKPNFDCYARFLQILNLNHSIASKREVVLTINNGAATIKATYVLNSKDGKETLFDRLANAIIFSVRLIGRRFFFSPDQINRAREFFQRMDRLVNESLGDAKDDMFCIDMLATAPAYQHRGYGGALLQAITSIADSQNRRVYLVSTNIDNTKFYNSHGFKTIATDAIGDKNPLWKKEPVVISLMVREVTTKEKTT